MKVKCISVKVKSFSRISAKAYKVEDFQGNTDIIPASQIYGEDVEVKKSDAYWVSEWILKQKNLTYGNKFRFFDSESRKSLPTYIIHHHKPTKIKPVDENKIATLKSN